MSVLKCVSLFFLFALCSQLLFLSAQADHSLEDNDWEMEDDLQTHGTTTDFPPLALSSFSFYEYLVGEWEVYSSIQAGQTSQQKYDNEIVRYSFEKDNSTSQMALVGKSFINNTHGEVSNELSVRVTFSGDVSAGSMLTGVDDDVDHMVELFGFNFVQPENGLAMSVGPWNGKKTKAHYQAIIAQPDKFVISVATLTNTNTTNTRWAHLSHSPSSLAQNEVSHHVVFTFRRIVHTPQKTFFQQYGTMIALGFMLMLNVWMKSRTASNEFRRRNVAAARTATNAATATAKKTDNGQGATEEAKKKK